MATTAGKIYLGNVLVAGGGSTPTPTPTPTPWVRNPSWPACEANSGDNKLTGLYAVHPDGGNFFSVIVSGTGTPAFNIDYGDGTDTDYGSGSAIYYEYDYANAALDGTDAPVTLTAATSTVNRTAHGYTNGMPVSLYNIATTVGFEQGQTYYVANATTNTFQLSISAYNTVSVLPEETTPQAVFFKPDGTKMYVIGSAGDDVNEYNLSTAWDTATASYLQNFSVAAQEVDPTGVFFKPDGTKMYVIGFAGDDVNEYDLGTAWDVSTASYLQNFSVAAQEINPQSVFFNPDGTRMYVTGYGGDAVYEYDLGTAWNVSTALYFQNFSVAAQEIDPTGVFFKPDGTKMYVTGYTGDAVYEYNLSTAWDVSTASYFQNFNVMASIPTGIFFKPDGTVMYVLGSGGDSVRGYTLSTAWDVSTATFAVQSQVVTFTNNGTATLLPYKIATVTITPTAGNSLSSINLYSKHNQTNLNNGYNTGWLDVAVAVGSLTSLAIGSSLITLRHLLLERVQLNQLGDITNFSSLFQNMYNLREVVIADTITSVTNTSNMFYGCYALSSVPFFDTASVTTMSSMFVNCFSLTSVPFFDTASVTTMASMFASCYSLTSVPFFDTSSVTTTSSMFQNCSSLTSVPLFDTSIVINTSSMFSACYSLTSVPFFNTASVTTMSSMFASCYSLTSVPLFNTSNVLAMSSLFTSCYSLTSVPLFDTSKVTSPMTSMFNSCYSLTSVPLFDTSNVTSMVGMFQSCFSLTSVPLFDTASVTTMSTMFNSCYSLTSVPFFNTSKVTNMASMFAGCYSLTSVPLFDTAKVTTMNSMFSACGSLTSVPALTTTTTSSATNFTSIFNSCFSLSRIQAKDFRFTFSVINCKLSSAALNEIYTNLPTVTGQTITVTGNYGNTGDNPTIATAKGWTVTG